MAKVTLNKDGTPRKRGSGKTKGAGCYAKITWRDLKRFVGTDVAIPVSRVWLRGLGAEMDKYVEQALSAPTTVDTAVEEPVEEPTEEKPIEEKEAPSPVPDEPEAEQDPVAASEPEAKPEPELVQGEKDEEDSEELPEPLFADNSLAATAYRYSQNFDL